MGELFPNLMWFVLEILSYGLIDVPSYLARWTYGEDGPVPPASRMVFWPASALALIWWAGLTVQSTWSGPFSAPGIATLCVLTYISLPTLLFAEYRRGTRLTFWPPAVLTCVTIALVLMRFVA